eukprot:3842971-Rhodomonas_salina.1
MHALLWLWAVHASGEFLRDARSGCSHVRLLMLHTSRRTHIFEDRTHGLAVYVLMCRVGAGLCLLCFRAVRRVSGSSDAQDRVELC